MNERIHLILFCLAALKGLRVLKRLNTKVSCYRLIFKQALQPNSIPTRYITTVEVWVQECTSVRLLCSTRAAAFSAAPWRSPSFAWSAPRRGRARRWRTSSPPPRRRARSSRRDSCTASQAWSADGTRRISLHICGPCCGSHWSRRVTIQGLWISDLEALARGKTEASMVWKSWLSPGLRRRLSKLWHPGRSKWPLLTHVNWCDYFWFGILLLFRWLVCILLLHLCRSESSNKSCWDPWRHAPICEPTNLWANRSV